MRESSYLEAGVDSNGGECRGTGSEGDDESSDLHDCCDDTRVSVDESTRHVYTPFCAICVLLLTSCSRGCVRMRHGLNTCSLTYFKHKHTSGFVQKLARCIINLTNGSSQRIFYYIRRLSFFFIFGADFFFAFSSARRTMR